MHFRTALKSLLRMIFSLCAGQTQSNSTVCNFSWVGLTVYTPLTSLLWKICSLALKEKFHLILAPCFPSLHFCYAQLSKHEERLDIRNQHLSPCTHKPWSLGSFSLSVQDYLLTVLLLQQATAVICVAHRYYTYILTFFERLLGANCVQMAELWE